MFGVNCGVVHEYQIVIKNYFERYIRENWTNFTRNKWKNNSLFDSQIKKVYNAELYYYFLAKFERKSMNKFVKVPS